jgi:hypothetical protein
VAILGFDLSLRYSFFFVLSVTSPFDHWLRASFLSNTLAFVLRSSSFCWSPLPFFLALGGFLLLGGGDLMGVVLGVVVFCRLPWDSQANQRTRCHKKGYFPPT